MDFNSYSKDLFSFLSNDEDQPSIKLYNPLRIYPDYEKLKKIQKQIDEKNRKLKAQEEKLLNDLNRQRYGKI